MPENLYFQIQQFLNQKNLTVLDKHNQINIINKKNIIKT